MADWIPFNINGHVRVRLKHGGMERLRKNHEEAFADTTYGRTHPWIAPAVDVEGYSDFQMHDFMKEFGALMIMGTEMPFDTEILIDRSVI